MSLTILASDGSQDVQTITREDYERLRSVDDIHVVRWETNTAGDW